jgi:hypothetical protein
MKKKTSAHDEWMHSRSRLKQAEHNAGISQALEDLKERDAHLNGAEEHARSSGAH